MSRPFMKCMKGLEFDNESDVKGILVKDKEAISQCQEECAQRITRTIRMEQESYLNDHPEVLAMLIMFVKSAAQQSNIIDTYAKIGRHFTRPLSVIDEEIREYLNLPKDGPYLDESKRRAYEDEDLYFDINKIILKHYPPEFEEPPPSEEETYFTTSSSFLSANTSSITLPTPEPVRTPVPTTSEIFYKLVSDTLNKATFAHVTEDMLKYDTAYVELMKTVENAMEITVMDIKEDIAELFNDAYYQFEAIIKERERIAAEIAWEKRMRKKLKRTLRRMNNFKDIRFKTAGRISRHANIDIICRALVNAYVPAVQELNGLVHNNGKRPDSYVTPPTPKSVPSSHESYKIAPPRPCICHPQGTYNRYPKDRFGIYLPHVERISGKSVTLTPNFSTHSVHKEGEEKPAAK